MPTARTRKTNPDDGDEVADEAAENKAVSAETETKTPDVAPLEPPIEFLPPPTPEPVGGPHQLIPAELGEYIVDDATGRPPQDPDTVFFPVNPHGTALRSTVRLIEHVGLGTYRTPTTRLLVPAGAEVRRPEAERIVAQLRAQAAALASE
ncbi:hypothetical protein ABT024_05455 [Streptomyces sp. NPDC002812]|uniref:hypothetical protein n=1 Tax=Streptomyces sp. NPDC002812 TaxID=3154434 RepID=UPI003330BF84